MPGDLYQLGYTSYAAGLKMFLGKCVWMNENVN